MWESRGSRSGCAYFVLVGVLSMNGRLLTERLLATTSLAALIFAGSSQSAYAVNPCPGGTDPGGNASNSGAIACVLINDSGTTSLTNTATGVIGPPSSIRSAISIASTGTLSGGINNAGRIAGGLITSTNFAVGIGVAGLVQGEISNSGTITVNATTAGFVEAYGIDIGNDLGATVSNFGGGISNGGTISVNVRAQGIDNSVGIVENVSTFSGNIINAAGATVALSLVGTAGSVNGAGISLSSDTISGNVINAGTVSVAATAPGSANATGIFIQGGTIAGGISAAARSRRPRPVPRAAQACARRASR